MINKKAFYVLPKFSCHILPAYNGQHQRRGQQPASAWMLLLANPQ